MPHTVRTSTTATKRRRKKVSPTPAAPRLIRRQIHADGSVYLHVRRNADSEWMPACTACHGDLVAMAALNRLQASCADPMVRALYLDMTATGVAMRADGDELYSLFEDLMPAVAAVPQPPAGAYKHATAEWLPVTGATAATPERKVVDELLPAPKRRSYITRRVNMVLDVLGSGYAWVAQILRRLAVIPVLSRPFPGIGRSGVSI